MMLFVCDPSPYHSFEEQWGAQLGELEARHAEEDAEIDDEETRRCSFLDMLFDGEFEPDLCDEANLERWTETQEPEEFNP